MEDGRRKQRNCVRARMKSKMGGESNDGRRKQKWEEKLCEVEDEGDKRLPVSHLQFPPLPVIRAAQPRELAASWQPFLSVPTSPFLGQNIVGACQGSMTTTSSFMFGRWSKFELLLTFCNLQPDGLILQAVICNEGWVCPRLPLAGRLPTLPCLI